ncbi:alkaline phosphatase PhoX [Brevundimonas vesicularis]|uniref:alkaline phosphatase PhoX n=1 Tax=Brevundimonas vesicularis TaxID=41276 RepID=UPI0038D39D3E
MIQSRRAFMASATALALAGYAQRAHAVSTGFVDGTSRNEVFGYGPMKPDPYGLLDLPEGFSYRVVSQVGQTMDDGLMTPDKFDGMGCFPLDDDRVILVRNHEVDADEFNLSAWGAAHRLANNIDRSKVYGVYPDPDGGVYPLGGGTSTLVYNLKTGQLERSHLSLAGTATNCAGGVTPWGSWLSCEESVAGLKDGLPQDHGWVFEVPATATGLVEPRPIKAMGRFKHEAACIDPRTGIVYLTEDVADSLFYRFIPNDRRDLHAGGRLQALAIMDRPSADTRNWDSLLWSQGQKLPVRWIDLEDVESPNADLNRRGHAAGAALFARGEGIHWAGDHLYFTCTSGGVGRHGQIIRYVPSAREGQADETRRPAMIDLFVEATDRAVLDYIDNITIAPNGHVIGCEDRQVGTNHIKGVTPDGRIYTLARNPQRHDADETNNEFAGVCFSPDGQTLFLNLYSPGATLAVTGPWDRFRV